ncbi:MAG TPA: hypothetical protein VI913_00490, partial [Candidatus Peribacteraceae bacterium]|nr:hypothetical protein [Candidatus Peribacteraceae bacterium]
MAREMEKNDALKDIGPIVVSVAGEIGNNSYDHNTGNWPDLMGSFFAYDLGKRIVVLADRGRGVLSTLRNTKPGLKDDYEALTTAFTEVLTGRAPEHRGNGLKFVRKAVMRFALNLKFCSGAAELEIRRNDPEFHLTASDQRIRGSLTLFEF